MKIDLNFMARKVDVDNRMPLRFYYRIADNLLKQANVYKEEKNLVDLYIMLLRFSSLVSETIPYHRDYHIILPREKMLYKKKLLSVLDELESIKPEVDCRVRELNEGSERNSFSSQTSLSWPSDDKRLPTLNLKQPSSKASQSLLKYNNDYSRGSDSSTQIDKHFQKLAIKLPPPNRETLSRHSFLGPNGFQSQWRGPSAEIKVQYPSSSDLATFEIPINSGSNQAAKDGKSEEIQYAMDSVLSLDDGRWKNPVEELCLPSLINEPREESFQLINIHQPCPPPVLAQIHPSKVADPRPGPANSCQNGTEKFDSFQHLHVPVRLMDDFLRLARANTERNLETCAILAGSLKNRVFHITTLIVPKQESTSDSCQTLNEEEIFEIQDRLSLFSLGWIHTHPTQTCFMSSVDLHTHYSYQIMLPEAIAIVMAPTDSTSPHGIFHLSDPGGVSVIRNCQERGFHPHEEPLDGTSIYEHCSHVFMNPKIKFEVVDLR